jgi:hypothetical protein
LFEGGLVQENILELSELRAALGADRGTGRHRGLAPCR